MKSAPACIARRLAAATLSRVPSSPVSRMTLRRAGPAGFLHGHDLVEDLGVVSGEEGPRSMTMSISSAPSATVSRTSASLCSTGIWPDGNPVATAAIRTVRSLPRNWTASGPGRGTHTRPRCSAGPAARGEAGGPCGTAQPPFRACRRPPGWSGRPSTVRGQKPHLRLGLDASGLDSRDAGADGGVVDAHGAAGTRKVRGQVGAMPTSSMGGRLLQMGGPCRPDRGRHRLAPPGLTPVRCLS